VHRLRGPLVYNTMTIHTTHIPYNDKENDIVNNEMKEMVIRGSSHVLLMGSLPLVSEIC